MISVLKCLYCNKVEMGGWNTQCNSCHKAYTSGRIDAIQEQRSKDTMAVTDLLYALRHLKLKPKYSDLAKLAKRIKNA